MNSLTSKAFAAAMLGMLLLITGSLVGCTRPASDAPQEKTVDQYSAQIARRPRDAALRTDRGVAYLKRGELEKALADFDEALRIDPKSARAMAYRGRVYLKQGDADAALKESNSALALDPKSVDGWVAMGLIYLEQRTYDNAITAFTNALSFSEKNAEALSERGKAYLEKGEWDRAIDDFTKAIAIAPDVELYVQRGNAYFYKGDIPAVRADLGRALRQDPRSAEGFAMRGRLNVRLGAFETAIADLDKALALDQNCYPARIERAYAYWGNGETEKALADCAVLTGPGVPMNVRAEANRIATRINNRQPFLR